ncbi:MAG TPA: TIGR01777 family protein [Desulfonatronum sp.]|nr:TIGR01777 family protein [Desulfonatronum sp.]
MTFFIMGGTGFVGRHLIAWLQKQGHSVMALARKEKSLARLPDGCRAVLGDPLRSGDWQQQAREADVLINLVGRSIMTRWNDASKKQILETRILSTRMAVEALVPERPAVLINANAVGYYPQGRNSVVTEKDPAGEGFLAEVCQIWQDEANKAMAKNARVVIARFGTVLGADGGAMAQMLPVFRKGLGGRLGSGRQWFAWIHILDLCRALEFAARNKNLSGPINCCAPQSVTNAEFTKAMGRTLHRPVILPVPAFLIRLALGDVAQAVLQGAKIVPKALENAGFAFRFPNLEGALEDIVGEKTS